MRGATVRVQDAAESSCLMQHGAGRHGCIDIDRTSRELQASGNPRVRVVEQCIPAPGAIEDVDAILGRRDDPKPSDERSICTIFALGKIAVTASSNPTTCNTAQRERNAARSASAIVARCAG